MAVFCFLSFGVTAFAGPAKFDIPAQAAPDALQLFIKQSGTQVMFVADEVKAVSTNAVTGEHEPAAALALLLDGTGYTSAERKSGWFTVVRAATEKPGSIEGSVREEKTGKPIVGAKVAIAGTDKFVLTDKRGRFTFEEAPIGDQELLITAEGMQNTKVTDVTVKPGHRHTISVINIPAQPAGVVKLDTYVVSAKKNDTVIELDPYSVEGNRPKPFSTANLDLTRTRDDVLPFQTFNARDVELSGATDLNDFFRNRLPQNFESTVNNENFGESGASVGQDHFLNNMNLRGWGSDETVYLLNGRRLPNEYMGTSADMQQNAPRLQGIPLASIERIEILSSAGSAIYGGNATGGIINIITRIDHQGGQLTLNYSTPADTHAPKRTIDFSYGGLKLPLGFHLRVGFSYSDSEPMQVGDRSGVSIERWRRLVLERDPSRLVSRTTTPFGALPNIRTVSTAATANLFGPGTSNFTTVPVGYTGSGGLSAFSPGTYNVELLDEDGGATQLARGSTIGIPTVSRTFTIALDRQLATDWRWSLDYMRSESEADGQTRSSFAFTSNSTNSSNPVVPAATPGNPFGQNVRVLLIDPQTQRPELEINTSNVTETISSVLRGNRGEWRLILDTSLAMNRNLFRDAVPIEPIGGWRNAFLTGSYRPFVDPRVSPHASSSFYEDFVALRSVFKGASKTYRATAKASGPLWRLPGGEIQFTVGLDWSRVDLHKASSYSEYQHSVTGRPVIPFGGTASIVDDYDQSPGSLFVFDTLAAYAEANIPVLDVKQAVPLVRKLEFFSSGRLGKEVRRSSRVTDVLPTSADPTTFVTTFVPFEYETKPYVHAFGFRYDMVDGLAFRVSRSIGFKPPTLNQVAPTDPPIDAFEVSDTRRDNQSIELAPTQYIVGGNPDLEPETTRSTNFGVVYFPRWLRGLRLSADYVESVRDDFIASLSPQETIDLEADLPGRVQRDTSDGHPSGVGPIQFVDSRNINFRQIVSKSADFSLEQEIRNIWGGRLLFTAAATKNISFKVQVSNDTQPVEQVRNPTATFSRQIQWNGNAQARWEGRRWTVGWSVKYFDDILAQPADYLLQGSDRAGWDLEHDAFISYRTASGESTLSPRSWTNGLSITLGVKNVFNREPRFWAATASGVAPYDSIAGRVFWLRLSKAL